MIQEQLDRQPSTLVTGLMVHRSQKEEIPSRQKLQRSVLRSEVVLHYQRST